MSFFILKIMMLYIQVISRKMPNRNPEETNIEVTVKGPRDNFIEDLSINIALIRKRSTYGFIMR